MQYKTGTVTVTNGSATVTGSGTQWLNEIQAGHVFVRARLVSGKRVDDPVVYTVAGVQSNTQLTLTAPYSGTSGSGQLYGITRDLTPMGKPLLAPSSIGTVPIFNEAVLKLEQQSNQLAGDLGTAATRNVATTAQALAGTAGVLPDAAGVHAAFNQYGLGVTTVTITSDMNTVITNGSYQVNGATNGPVTAAQNFGILEVVSRGDVSGRVTQTMTLVGGTVTTFRKYTRVLSGSPSSWTPWRELYHTGNTTVDGNGFIKQASPIVQLHSDRIVKNGDFESDFERVDTGHYLIKNTLGFAQSGWWIETPKDANGNIKVFVEYEENDGDITIKTYEPDYSTGKATAGEPADIPEGRWIDLRLHELPPEQDDLQTDTMAQTD